VKWERAQLPDERSHPGETGREALVKSPRRRESLHDPRDFVPKKFQAATLIVTNRPTPSLPNMRHRLYLTGLASRAG